MNTVVGPTATSILSTVIDLAYVSPECKVEWLAEDLIVDFLPELTIPQFQANLAYLVLHGLVDWDRPRHRVRPLVHEVPVSASPPGRVRGEAAAARTSAAAPLIFFVSDALMALGDLCEKASLWLYGWTVPRG